MNPDKIHTIKMVIYCQAKEYLGHTFYDTNLFRPDKTELEILNCQYEGIKFLKDVSKREETK